MTATAAQPKRRLLFFSGNWALRPNHWGGSEELWSQAAMRLARQGHQVAAIMSLAPFPHKMFDALREAGVELIYSGAPLPLARRIAGRLQELTGKPRLHWSLQWVLNYASDLVVVSQGNTSDSVKFTNFLADRGLPYLLVSQQASIAEWPEDRDLAALRRSHLSARTTYFVSADNARITQEQLGEELPNRCVIWNPFVVDTSGGELPWPEESTWRLAFPGRLSVSNKAQDVLIRVLAQPKWRERPLEVNLFGLGQNEESLKRLVEYLHAPQVRFRGQTANIREVWAQHHALLMTSRREGMPLVLLEALMCNRTAILTPFSGAREIVQDNVTGFISRDFGEESFDDALERAWARRAEWRTLGQAAGQAARELVPADPVGAFVERIGEHLSQLGQP